MRLLLGVVLGLSFLVKPAFSAIRVWTNPNSGNWNQASNWSGNQVPGPFDRARIQTAGVIVKILPGENFTVDTLEIQAGSTLLIDGSSGGVTTLTVENNNKTLPPGAVFRPDHHGIGGEVRLRSDHAGTNKARLIFTIAARHDLNGEGRIIGEGKSEFLIQQGKVVRNYLNGPNLLSSQGIVGSMIVSSSAGTGTPLLENFGNVVAMRETINDLGELVIKIPIEDNSDGLWGAANCGTLILDGDPSTVQPMTNLDGDLGVARNAFLGWENAWLIFRRPVTTSAKLIWNEGTIILEDEVGTNCLTGPGGPEAITFTYGVFESIVGNCINPACYPTEPPPFYLWEQLYECGQDLGDCVIVPNNSNGGNGK